MTRTSDTTVFVDDAVQGRLPMVCVRTGAPADGLLPVRRQFGGLSGWALLLIFLGPVGWIVLLALAFSSRSRELLVRLPYSRAAVERERRDFHVAIVAFAATVLAGIGAAWLGATRAESEVRSVLFTMVAVAAIAGVVATIAFAVRYVGRRPSIELDASGRWVTVRGVHPAFAAALRDEQVVRGTAPT